jgi:hypothetical protein
VQVCQGHGEGKTTCTSCMQQMFVYHILHGCLTQASTSGPLFQNIMTELPLPAN